MKLGQTSTIYFLSRFVASVLGFVATIYFARLLGAEPLGIYYLVLGLVSWLAIAGKVGVSGAITKRISEGEEREQYVIAGTVLIATLFTVLAIGIVSFRSHVNSYVGYPAAGYLVLILFVTLCTSVVESSLVGLHLVHVEGILSPVRTGGRAVFQIGALLAGMTLTGLFLGYIAGYVLVVLIGTAIIVRYLRDVTLPQRRHFRRLFDYAKFSWLGSLQSKMFNYTDVIVLGFFVPSALIGIYSIAWNIAQFLILFAGAISTSVFPEMSELSAKRDPQAVADLVEDALSYAGLLLIPGLVGGAIIGDHLLRIYGAEFTQGSTVLLVLIVANLVMSYQNQILNTFNAIDRPDLSFRANALFVIANISLNLVLISLFGWHGAAVATALSVVLSFVVAYRYLDSIIDFTVPYAEIGHQWVAAIGMGVVIYLLEPSVTELEGAIPFGATVGTIVLVAVGACVYFLALITISRRFRATVSRNLPVDAPW